MYRFINKVKVKVKARLSTPFQFYYWMKGNCFGVSTHFIWKIPPRANHQAKVDGERHTAIIIGELALEQDFHYGRAMITTYFRSVIGHDLICSKVAAIAIWQFITSSKVDHGDESNIIAAVWASDSGGKGIVLDMRTMNGKTKDEAFDPFL